MAKHFGDLSRKVRDRYASAGQEWGLSRKSVREMYNRGTYNPGGRGDNAIPRKFRDIYTQAWKNMRAHLGDHLGWKGARSDEHIKANLKRASPAALLAIANATEDELTVWAEAGASSQLTDKQRERQALDAHPGWNRKDVGFFDSHKRWHSVFWYH